MMLIGCSRTFRWANGNAASKQQHASDGLGPPSMLSDTFLTVKRQHEDGYGEYRTNRVALQTCDGMAVAVRASRGNESPA